MDAAKLGTVITTLDSPSVSSFAFVIDERNPVKRGQFISVLTEEGTLIATVINIFKTNRYFESAGSVKEYSKANDLQHSFPIKEWEYTIAEAKLLGVYAADGSLNRPSFPPSPGNSVLEVAPDLLNKFLGFDQENGLHLGDVQQHSLKAKFNLTKLLQKHLAVLAMSGAGKSYAVSVLIEELLSRKSGKIAVLIIDNHGEYVCLSREKELADKIKIIDATEVKIALQHFSAQMIAKLFPSMSAVQTRELGKILISLRTAGKPFEVSDVISAVEQSENLTEVSAGALLAWLSELDSLGIFGKADWPNFDAVLEPGKAVILNFREMLDLRRKQLIVDYVSKRIFGLRRKEMVPPYLEIIEEAHNFCPEKMKSENALSKGIIETLAREGRKFYANLCLISQRPVQLSTTALSQCNTHIILRVTNPYDLDHIKKSAESISQSTLDVISSLKVGEALVLGEAVNYPVFVKIRQRKSKESHGTKLEEYAVQWEGAKGKLAKGSEFL
jgi:DNA helicase HerA-like ATPase